MTLTQLVVMRDIHNWVVIWKKIYVLLPLFFQENHLTFFLTMGASFFFLKIKIKIKSHTKIEQNMCKKVVQQPRKKISDLPVSKSFRWTILANYVAEVQHRIFWSQTSQ
jgi:hypothetical protein